MSKDYIRWPWHVGPVDDTCITDDNGESVAYVEGDYEKNPYEMEARARLIAAAPEMLEALKRAPDRSRFSDDHFFRVAVSMWYEDWVGPAIAKASPVVEPDEPYRPMVDHVSGQRIRERERYD